MTEDRLLTVEEVARLLKVSKQFVYYNWRELGGFKLPSRKGKGGSRAPIRFFESKIMEVLHAIQKETERENQMGCGYQGGREEIYEGLQNQDRSIGNGGSHKEKGQAVKDKYDLFS